VHVTEVYTYARSYLKGFFNAIEAFHWDRDLDGWRLREATEEAAQSEIMEASEEEDA